MPPQWPNNMPQPSAEGFIDDGCPPPPPLTPGPSRDAQAKVDHPSKGDFSGVPASVLELLEEQRREAELLLRRHHTALCQAVERIVAPSASASSPSAEEVAPAAVLVVDASAAEGAAGAESAEEECLDPGECAAGAEEALAAPGGDPGEPATGAEEALAAPGQDALPPADSLGAEAMETPVVAKTLTNPDSAGEKREGSTSKSKRGFVHKLKTTGTMPALEPGSTRARVYSEIKGLGFEALMGVMILANTLVIFVQLEFDGRKAHDVLYNNAAPVSDTTDLVFRYLSYVFTVVFLIELALKLYALRLDYFRVAFNNFDLVVVVITTIDVFVVSQSNISFLRTMKVLRVARVLRVIRTMELFQELRVLMKTIVLSFLSIFWSMLILFIFMLVGSLLLCQTLQETIVNSSIDREIREQAYNHYGTSTTALYTIFEVTFSGCWPNYARYLIFHVSPWYWLFWVPYVLFVVFTLIRIIYALLLKDTMQAAANDAEEVARSKATQAKKVGDNLRELFMDSDESGDGFLSKEEFSAILQHKKVSSWMQVLGVDTQDQETLFEILDEEEDGRLNIDEFVSGIMRMKGQAHQQQLLRTMRDVHRLLEICKAMRQEVREALHLGEQPPSAWSMRKARSSRS